MNIFEMMGMAAPEVTVVETKKESKNSKTKTERKSSQIKNSISLPGHVVIQGAGKFTITRSTFAEQAEISDLEIKTFAEGKFPYLKNMQAVKISSDTYLLGYSCTHKNTDFTVNSKTRLIIGDFSVPLGDENLEESKASTEQLISFAEIAGLPLGKKTDFLQIENRIIAIPQNSDDKEFNALTLPFKIHFFGNEWEDIDVTDMTEISKQLILDTVIKKYPEFKDRCVAQVKDNLVCISISLDTDKDLKNSVKNGKKEETYKVDDKTVIKFYGMTVDTGLQPGNYTAKDICKAMEKAGISECKMTSTIIMKQIGNTIMTGVKFGGTKGAADFLTQNELELIRQPFSNFEKASAQRYLKVHPAWLFEQESGISRFGLRLPKIPADIYNKIVTVFKTVAQLYNKECLCRVYWSLENNSYKLLFPYQQATISSVQPSRSEDEEFLLTHLPVAEFHSHGRAYDAFFSHIDDIDEQKRYGLFGVFSFYQDADNESALFRCCSGQDRQIMLSKDQLFEQAEIKYESVYAKKLLSSKRFSFN